MTASPAQGWNWNAYRSASLITNRSRTGCPASFDTSDVTCPPCFHVTVRSTSSPIDLRAIVQGITRDRLAARVLDFDAHPADGRR